MSDTAQERAWFQRAVNREYWIRGEHLIIRWTVEGHFDRVIRPKLLTGIPERKLLTGCRHADLIPVYDHGVKPLFRWQEVGPRTILRFCLTCHETLPYEPVVPQGEWRILEVPMKSVTWWRYVLGGSAGV